MLKLSPSEAEAWELFKDSEGFFAVRTLFDEWRNRGRNEDMQFCGMVLAGLYRKGYLRRQRFGGRFWYRVKGAVRDE